ncbi:LLM class flavin-dependent oxidoreductase [Streptomyces sp. C1-1]|uniref:LLM class flavin-dependent oxidoreductase n=1 Tax=Streptomyces sp. C1-1 TaxID=3231173 RepID=UPI003D066131
MSIHLNLFMLLPGHHDSAWLHPECESVRVTDVDYCLELTRIAEKGLMDSVFIADALWHKPRSNYCAGLEPLTLLGALALGTEHIGLIATASTSYYEPFHLARMFASLDHISGGRAGWNIVVSNSVNEARNFNRSKMLSHRERYERAEEFLEVAGRLWESWDEDAVIRDRSTGHYTDPDRIHLVEHQGEYFKVRGPLNIQRSPQVRPFMVQAGASEAGRSFAARHADAVFAVQENVDDAARFRTEMRRRAAANGRTLKVLPGLLPIVGSTQAEADQKKRELIQMQATDYALEHISMMLNVDLTDCSADAPFPVDRLPSADSIQGNRTTYELITGIARRGGVTVGDIIALQGFGRGHLVVTGTPERIADVIETWIEGGAADGFNIMPPVFPVGLVDFVDEVVPLLQKRGLFRTEYGEKRLRSRYE